MKSIIKEIAIIILLCVAICLILGIIFYSYIPSNVVIPGNVEAYATSNEIKEEIEEEIVEYPKENLVFEITDSDLTLYRRTKSYDEGKANPFAASNSTSVGTDINTNTAGNGENNTSKKDNSENNSGETFFKDSSMK